MKILIASQNQNKINEIKAVLPGYELEGLDPLLFPQELLEEGDTLEANALQKVRQVYEKTGLACFADDTGLEVEALGNEPGVKSARYAGENKDSLANMDLLLTRLTGIENRNAQFRTVIALIWNGNEHLFEGVSKGKITRSLSGSEGFGYDPVFEPDGYSKTFAQMSTTDKNAISHRGRAVAKLVDFLSSQQK